MTQNPYAASTNSAQPNHDADPAVAAQRLDTLSRITVGACVVWFGLMVMGRFFDENAPPIRAMFGFYFVLGFAPALGLYGALSSLKRKRYAMCILGATSISVPCLGPWLGLTLPIGIWSFVLLRRHDIRSSFTSATHRDHTDRDSPDDVLAHAAHLDTIGDWDDAITAYRDAATRWPEHAVYIDNCISEIESKRSAAS